MKASVSIQVSPRISDTKEQVRIVDKVIEYIISTGLNYKVTPFDTVIEGDFDKLMEIIKKCQELVVEEGIGVSTYIKVAYDPHNSIMTIDEKTSKYEKQN